MTRRATFTKTEVANIVKGAIAGGIQIGRLEVSSGRIAIYPPGATEPINDLDRELEEFEARHGEG
jgi:hypothetical protein